MSVVVLIGACRSKRRTEAVARDQMFQREMAHRLTKANVWGWNYPWIRGLSTRYGERAKARNRLACHALGNE